MYVYLYDGEAGDLPHTRGGTPTLKYHPLLLICTAGDYTYTRRDLHCNPHPLPAWRLQLQNMLDVADENKDTLPPILTIPILCATLHTTLRTTLCPPPTTRLPPTYHPCTSIPQDGYVDFPEFATAWETAHWAKARVRVRHMLHCGSLGLPHWWSRSRQDMSGCAQAKSLGKVVREIKALVCTYLCG